MGEENRPNDGGDCRKILEEIVAIRKKMLVCADHRLLQLGADLNAAIERGEKLLEAR
jgi:hypothetical protein